MTEDFVVTDYSGIFGDFAGAIKFVAKLAIGQVYIYGFALFAEFVCKLKASFVFILANWQNDIVDGLLGFNANEVILAQYEE